MKYRFFEFNLPLISDLTGRLVHKGICISLFILVKTASLSGQPYFDVAGISGWNILTDSRAPSATETYGSAFVSLPVELGKGNKLILSPFFETRTISTEIPDQLLSLVSGGIPVTWLHYITDSTWSFTLTVIPRLNSTILKLDSDFAQTGGALIGTYRIKPTLKVRMGLYYNKEFFSDFFIPLVGVDWRVNKRLTLFGNIPNSLKLEYKFTNSAFAGVNFKSITNSYRYFNYSGYYKIQDNHVCLFADFYPSGNIVLAAEAGHTVLRKFRNRSEYMFSSFNQQGFIFKAGIYYRIRI